MVRPHHAEFLLAVAFCSVTASAFDRAKHKITAPMAAVYTPMAGRYGKELNLAVIPSYLEFLKRKDIHNILVAGSNGESLSLSVQERKALAEAWGQAAVASGVSVYMHIGAESLPDAAELMAHAARTQGLAGAMAMTPVYFKPSVATLHDFLAEVASAAPDFPFWFYHFPDDTGVLPGQAHAVLDMIDKSGRIPNMMGIKFTDYNLMDFSLCLQVGGGKYNMLYGRDEQGLPALELGADSLVSSTINYAPSLREAFALYRAGRREAAYARQAENARLCSMFGKYDPSKNVQKNILNMSGLDAGGSRLPKQDLDGQEYAELQKELLARGFIDLPEVPALRV